MSDAFVSLDEKWCYTYMNEKAGKIFGKDPKEMIGKHIWTEFPEGVGQPFHLNYEKAMKEKVFISMEEYYPPLNKWFENRINPTKEGIAIFFQDITERKEIETALIESGNRFEAIFNSVNEAIFIHDADTGKILEVNNKVVEMLGITHDEVLQHTISDFSSGVHPYTHREAVKWIRKCSLTEPQIFEWHIKDKSGNLFWCEINMRRAVIGTVERILVSIRNISDHKKAEEELKLSNFELTSLNTVISESSGQTDVKSIMTLALDEALYLTGLEGGTVCSITEDQLLHLIVDRNTSEETKKDLQENEIKVGECLCGHCASHKKPLILRTREEVLTYSSREVLRNELIRFHAAFPIIGKGKSLGVLCVFSYTDLKPTERSLKLVETLTNQMSLSIENANLYEKVKKQVVDLQLEVSERKEAEKKLQFHKENLEELVKERTIELESKNLQLARLNKVFVGREVRMAELKKQIAELEKGNNDK